MRIFLKKFTGGNANNGLICFFLNYDYVVKLRSIANKITKNVSLLD